MKEKRYMVVDKETGEVVAETDNGKTGPKSVLFTVLGTVAGCISFFVVFLSAYYIIAFISSVPFLRSILYLSSDTSWTLISMPGPLGVIAGGMVCRKICQRAAPACILIAVLYTLAFIYLLIHGSLTIQSGLTGVIIIIAAIIFAVMPNNEKTYPA